MSKNPNRTWVICVDYYTENDCKLIDFFVPEPSNTVIIRKYSKILGIEECRISTYPLLIYRMRHSV